MTDVASGESVEHAMATSSTPNAMAERVKREALCGEGLCNMRSSSAKKYTCARGKGVRADRGVSRRKAYGCGRASLQ